MVVRIGAGHISLMSAAEAAPDSANVKAAVEKLLKNRRMTSALGPSGQTILAQPGSDGQSGKQFLAATA
jgi:hypothetical protein